MLKGYKYRIYPNKQQEEQIQKTFGCKRFVYNQCLAYREEKHKNENISLSKIECNNWKNQVLKKKYEWLNEVDKFALDKEDDTEKNFKLNWYDNEYLTLCPHCYFGRLKTCKYCGKVLSKGVNRCDCDDFLEQEREEQRIKYQETINKATEIDLKDTSYYIYDEQSDKYFTDEGEFVDYYLQEYKDGSGGCSSFNEFFEYEVPKVLWNCEETKISMDADSIIDNACEELHEDARDNISDEKELQEFLNKWCDKQSGTTSYYPCYREYVRVQKEWFDE